MLAQVIDVTASLRPLLWMAIVLLVLCTIGILAAHSNHHRYDGVRP